MSSNFAGPWSAVPRVALTDDTRIAVLGGGLAGAHVAFQLARRGKQVTVLDRHENPAAETSAHPGIVLFPMLALGFEPMARIYHTGYELTLQHLAQQEAAGVDVGWHPTSVIHFPVKSRLQKIFERFASCEWHHERIRRLSESEVCDKLGREAAMHAFEYPYSGWFDPRRWVQALLQHENIQFQGGVQIADIQKNNGCWQLRDDVSATVLEVDVLVLACASDVTRFAQTSWLPIKRNRGQLAYVDADLWQAPRQVICHEGYFIPRCGDHHLLGATFDLGDETDSLRVPDQQQLLDALRRLFPDFPRGELPLQGRVAWRVQSYDRLPIAGPVADREAFNDVYASYYQDRKRQRFADAPCVEGLYVTTGHAARGSVSCTLAGELLAAEICGEVLPIDEELQAFLNPNRFLIRNLK